MSLDAYLGGLKATGKSVIEDYLNGNSYETISADNQISKGTVFNMINRWKNQIAVPDIDSLREFSVLVNKSGLTVEQCAQGFRFIKILSNFGITDELEIDLSISSDGKTPIKYSHLDENGGIANGKLGKSRGGVPPTRRNSFYMFIGSLYNQCKIHGIDPSIIIGWINDLLDFGSSDFLSNTIDVSAEDPVNDNAINLPKNSIVKNTKNQICFVSKIDGYLEQMKLKFQGLQQAHTLLLRDIERAKGLKNAIDSDLDKAMKRERSIMKYYSWYKSLTRELRDEYGLDIREELSTFAKAINDFKGYDYNVLDIINDHKELVSVREEIQIIQNMLEMNRPAREKLLKEIEFLEEKRIYSIQSMNTYEELQKRGLGLKELKRLFSTLVEISRANNLPDNEALPKFLNDVEKQYDNKLGFESIIKSLKTEKEKLQEEIPEYKWYLQLQGIVSHHIIHLNNSGVTNEDIININNLVLSFKNSHFIDDLSSGMDGNNTIKNDTVSNNKFWIRFIEKLRSLKNINVAIDQSLAILNKLKMEVEKLDRQKQELEKNYSDAVVNLNLIVSQMSYSIDAARQIYQDLDKRILNSHRLNPLIINLLILKNRDEEYDNRENNVDK